MAFELKADDTMPWGKYRGMTLREIYKNATSYYRTYILNSAKYEISAKTRKILESDLPEVEHSQLPGKCTANKTSKELDWDMPVNWGPYKRQATRLVDVAHENPSYYRYLLQNGVYYISQRTMKHIALVNAGKPPIIPEKDKE